MYEVAFFKKIEINLSLFESGGIRSAVTKSARQDIKDLFGIDTGSVTYGRKLDVMLTERETDVALCAIEWKKKEVEVSKLLLQQCKNLRVNKCHLAHILKMELVDGEKSTAFITGMDRMGKQVKIYIPLIFMTDNC